MSGRERANGGGSVQASPIVGPHLEEEGISLSDIPINTGGAVAEHLNLREQFEDDSDDLLTDTSGTPEEDLEKQIQEQEQRQLHLQKQKRLAELKQANLKLKNDISVVHAQFDKELDRKQLVNEQRTNDPRLDGIRASGNQHFGSVPGQRNQVQAAPQQQEARVRSLREVSAVNELPTLHQAQEQVNVPTLNSLRSRQELQAAADAYITENSILEPTERVSGNFSVTGNLTSGRGARTETGVVRQIVWPHTRLEGRMINPSYEKLNFLLLLIGELNILEDPLIDRQETVARIKQLKRVCTYVDKNCEWQHVREFHGGFLAGVERSGGWSIDSTELAAQYLCFAPRQQQRQQQQKVVYMSQPKCQQGKREQEYVNVGGELPRFFCSRYNGKACDHIGDHDAVIGGQIRYAEHICAVCLLDYSEYNEHPELDCTRPRLKRRNRNRRNGGNATGGAGATGSVAQ